MAEPGQLPSDGETRAADDIDEVLSRANPNPDRIGCPPRDTLVALARRALPIEDPAYGHLVKCSPCYREFRALQTSAVRYTAGPRRWWIAAGAAAALAAAAAGVWWANSQPDPAPAAAGSADLVAQLDLRPYTVTRGTAQGESHSPLALPHGIVTLTLLLPTGSEAGDYEIQLLDTSLRSRAEARGSAEVQGFVTKVGARVDLRSLPRGTYHFAVRRTGEEWRLFPARID